MMLAALVVKQDLFPAQTAELV